MCLQTIVSDPDLITEDKGNWQDKMAIEYHDILLMILILLFRYHSSLY